MVQSVPRPSGIPAFALAVSVMAAVDASAFPSYRKTCPAPSNNGKYLQLGWSDCDYAQLPLNPFWIDSSAAAGSVAPRKTSPRPSGAECDNFPFPNDVLTLPDECMSPAPAINAPSGSGFHHDICKIGSEKTKLYGHVNFQTVAMEGEVRFLEQSNPDLDYNWALVATDGLPVTDRNGPSPGMQTPMIELEHFSPESTDQFGVRWWSDLQQSISDDYAEDSEDWQFARGYVTSVPAYIVGLFGLDCEHGCVTELHPIYGMALRSVARRPAREPQFDRWAFFARNAGSEGFCSTGQLLNYEYEYLSLLARPPKDQPFTDVVIKGWWVVNHPATSGVTVSVVKVAEGAVIVVRFPPGDNSYEMIEGEVVFQWL